MSTLHTLAEYFKVTIGDLTEKSLSNKNAINNSTVEIVLIEFHEIDDFLITNRQKYEKSITVEVSSSLKEKIFAVKVTNNAMSPFFEKGTVFVICISTVAHDGDLVLVKFGKSPACLRRVFIEEESYFFSPISGVFEKQSIKSKNFCIYGFVLKAIQNFHE